MNLSRRLVRLAIGGLVLWLVSLLTATFVNLFMQSHFTPILQRWNQEVVDAKEPPTDYQAWLETLPQPPGWVSYTVFRSTDQFPFRSTALAAASSHRTATPGYQLMRGLGIVQSIGSGAGNRLDGSSQIYFNWTYLTAGPLFEVLAVVGFAGFWLCLALWIYQDAKLRNQKQAVAWLTLGIVGGPVAMAIWLIQRPSPPPPPPVCPSCKTDQVEDATYCVSCGTHLKPTCPECGRAIELGWKHCPTCGNHLDQVSA